MNQTAITHVQILKQHKPLIDLVQIFYMLLTEEKNINLCGYPIVSILI